MFKNMDGLMKQAQDMQRRISETQEKLKSRVVEGVAGGGMVKAQVNGKQELLNIKIEKEVVDPKDVEMLEDLILAAINQAIQKSHEMVQEEMGKVTGGMHLPGIFG